MGSVLMGGKFTANYAKLMFYEKKIHLNHNVTMNILHKYLINV